VTLCPTFYEAKGGHFVTYTWVLLEVFWLGWHGVGNMLQRFGNLSITILAIMNEERMLKSQVFDIARMSE
jgi:hypothetical protein